LEVGTGAQSGRSARKSQDPHARGKKCSILGNQKWIQEQESLLGLKINREGILLFRTEIESVLGGTRTARLEVTRITRDIDSGLVKPDGRRTKMREAGARCHVVEREMPPD